MRFRVPRYRGVAPLTAAGAKMSRREYEEWRDAHTWDPSRGTGLVIETDLAPAAWIEPLLLGRWSADLAMLPGGFKAYARLFFRPCRDWPLGAAPRSPSGPLHPPARAEAKMRRMNPSS